jgi:hypothetical protein
MTVAGALKKLTQAKKQLMVAHRAAIKKARAGGSRVAGGTRKRRTKAGSSAGSVKQRKKAGSTSKRGFYMTRRAGSSRVGGGSRVAGAWYHDAAKRVAKAPGRAGKFILKHSVGRMGKALASAWRKKR